MKGDTMLHTGRGGRPRHHQDPDPMPWKPIIALVVVVFYSTFGGYWLMEWLMSAVAVTQP